VVEAVEKDLQRQYVKAKFRARARRGQREQVAVPGDEGVGSAGLWRSPKLTHLRSSKLTQRGELGQG
jgi:hypothetical protein